MDSLKNRDLYEIVFHRGLLERMKKKENTDSKKIYRLIFVFYKTTKFVNKKIFLRLSACFLKINFLKGSNPFSKENFHQIFSFLRARD